MSQLYMGILLVFLVFFSVSLLIVCEFSSFIYNRVIILRNHLDNVHTLLRIT